MPLPLMILALWQPAEASALAALADAVTACDRPAVSLAFQGEEERRSRFLTRAYGEQEALAVSRAVLAGRRAALRSGVVPGDSDEKARGEAVAIGDRQAALDDARHLERLRQETVDQLRRQFLTQCGSERGKPGRGAEASK